MSPRHISAMPVMRAAARGVTLIELMVSLAVGLLLIAGATTVYLQSRDTYRVNEAAARLQEVARYALDTIEPDVRLAGFWGLTNNPQFIENRATATDTQNAVDADVASPNCGNNWIVDVERFLDARDAEATEGDGYNLSCDASDPADWADVLIVRRASTDTRPLSTDGRPQIQTNRIRGVIFNDGALPSGFAAPPVSETRNLIVHAYYISRRGNGANNLPQYQLRRQTLVGGPDIQDVEIISGVEDLQVQFGVDRNGDNNADTYVDAGAVPANARIVAARIWLRIVADDADLGLVDSTNYTYANTAPGTFNDKRRRVLISKTIQIRNSRA